MTGVPQAPRVTFRVFGAADADDLQALFERCAEFYVMSEGEPPAKGSALEELQSCAPGKTIEDSLSFGLFHDHRLAGFVQVARDYPKPDEWWLGFLIFDPAARARGLGTEAHAALIEWAAANGARVMWLGVLEQNTSGERFWRRMGYVERERQRWTARTGFQSNVIVMSRTLG